MSDNAPLPQSSIVLYQTEDGRTRIECRFEDETIWLTQALVAELFQLTVPTVNEHLKGILADGELGPEATIRKFRMVRLEGKREVTREIEHYNLEMIIAIGYRVRSTRGTQFRQWATARLSEYLVKGFTMDDARLKNPPGKGHTDYFDELLERIRDIRASERRVYLRVRDILALAADYAPSEPQTQTMFQAVQNKLHFAVTGKTAPELIAERADSAAPNMGLTAWKGGGVRKGDVTVAKNYLSEDEISELNLLGSSRRKPEPSRGSQGMMRMRQSTELTGTRTRRLRVLLLCALFCAWSCAAIGCTGLKDGSDTAGETGSPDAEADADHPGDGDGDGDRDSGSDAGSGSDSCEGRDGTTFCVGDSIRSCPGPVDEPCSGDDQCVDLNGAGLCVCAVGSAASASCAPAEECGADNGGCDSLTACALIGGEPACGSCPVGFTGNGLDGCVATLIGITVANGELLTAITPETTAYEARVSVFERRAHITFQIPAEASLEIDGDAVDTSEPWGSKVLQSGENAFDLRLDVPGHAQVRFDLVLRREAVQRAYIKADPPAVDDGFGRVVCLDGDQLLVGNFVEDRRGMASTALRDTGSAYIFEHTASGWEQQAYLKPEALTRDAWFGSSVILDGDVALISALQQDGTGAVYTFTRSGSTWTEGQVLESGTPLTDSWFGLDMVLHDDLLFVGEPYVGAGRIYLFKRGTEGFTQQAVLRSSRNQTDGNFGSAIAVSGDTMVASATFDGTGLNVGAAYVFEREGEDWNESQRLVGRNTTDGDEFGYALDMRGDLIAIGGPYNEARGLDAGAVYIFERSGSQWVEQTMLVASNGGALYNFGISVKFLSDDLLVIGSTGESSSLSTMDPDESNASASAAGAIYVFGRNGDDWVQEAYIKAAFPGENDAFGTSLSFSNGRLAVGAYQESGGSSGVNGDQLNDTSSASGAVYLFE